MLQNQLKAVPTYRRDVSALSNTWLNVTKLLKEGYKLKKMTVKCSKIHIKAVH